MYDPKINAKFSLRGSEKMNPAWWGGEPVSTVVVLFRSMFAGIEIPTEWVSIVCTL